MVRLPAALVLVAAVLVGSAGTAYAASSAAPHRPSAESASEGEPSITTEAKAVAEGGTVRVSGTDWQPDTAVTLLLCGQNGLVGTEACANSDSRAATTDARGAFSRTLPVVAPPQACPCVVKAVAVTGEHAWAETAFAVTGHPVEPLPEDGRSGTERLAVLDAKLEGSEGVLNWFGVPPERRLVLTVANQGTAPARNPVFEVGTAQDVYAHDWVDRRWNGTLEPGEQKTVTLDVELGAAAYGDHRVGVRYAQTVLAEQSWQVGRPWGLHLLGLLLMVAGAWGLWRVAQLLRRRLRPRGGWRASVHTSRPGTAVGRLRDRMETYAEPADDVDRPREPKPRRRRGPRLPWLSPDLPAAHGPAEGAGTPESAAGSVAGSEPESAVPGSDSDESPDASAGAGVSGAGDSGEGGVSAPGPSPSAPSRR